MTLFKRQPKTPDPTPDPIPQSTTIDNHVLHEYVTCATCAHLTLRSRAKEVEVYYYPVRRVYSWKEDTGSGNRYEYYCPDDKPRFDLVVFGPLGEPAYYYRRVAESLEEIKAYDTPEPQPTATPNYPSEEDKERVWQEFADADLIRVITRALEKHDEPLLAGYIYGRKLQPK